MENLLGLLRIRIKRGVNLAVRDFRSSDPYVVVALGKQKLKTRVIKNNVNPEWNEDLTLPITDPNLPVKLISGFRSLIKPKPKIICFLSIIPMNSKHQTSFLEMVYDHDTFSMDDKMGVTEIKLKQFIEALKMTSNGLASGTIISRMKPCKQNLLAEESCVVWQNGKIVQDLCLRLRDVECGELEIQLKWLYLPGTKQL